MPLNSGMAGSFGFAAETQWALPVTPTRFVPLVEESVQTEIERLESDSIIAGARVMRSSQWTPSIMRSEGDIGLELYDGSIGLLLEHCMGGVASSGTNPAVHTYSVGDLTGKGLTVQFGRPSRDGTVVPFTYAGAKITSWELGIAVGEIATLGITVIAKTETTATGLAVPSYNPLIRPMNFAFGSLTLGNSSLCVRSATISGENNLTTDRVCLGQRTIDEPVETDLREYSGEMEVEFGANGSTDNLELYRRYLDGLEGTMALTLRNSTSTASVTLRGNVRTDGETPNIGGRDMLTYSLSFKMIGTNTDASALVITQASADTTP